MGGCLYVSHTFGETILFYSHLVILRAMRLATIKVFGLLACLTGMCKLKIVGKSSPPVTLVH